MLTRKSFYALALASVVLGTSLAAQGIVIDRRVRPIEPPRPTPRAQQITIKSHAIQTTIEGQTATTVVTQTFHNPNTWQLEGEYIFPLGENAALSDFAMTMNGEMVKGELLDSVQARNIYEETVRRMIDPGLLEYTGQGLFKARVFPVLPQKDLTIKFTYTSLLEYDSGLVKFSHPLRTSSFSPLPLENVSVNITLKTDETARTIYSPTHNIEVIRQEDNTAVIGMELTNNQPTTDFELYYGFGEGATTANVFSYREAGTPGYFLALLTPKVELTPEEILPKDVIVVLDTSGSMDEDGKIDQARKALAFMVNKLNATDRFALVTFSTMSRKLHEELTFASDDAKKAAIAKIEKLEATGGTNLAGALTDAYDLADDGEGEVARPTYVVIFSDGIPTMGDTTNVQTLAKMAREKRADHIRLFPFGVGNDVNTWLLDTLAEENRGQREYIKPGEDMEIKVSNFANKIASPVLSNVTLKIDGAEIHDLHPQVPGDLFAGTQLSLAGRFDKPGKHTLLLEGTVSGEKRAFEYTVDLAAEDAGKTYLPRMWAVRRVGFLMDQINMKGHDEELKKEIVRLGTKFGIVTPYTSFLVVEDTPLPQPGAEMPGNRRGGDRAVGGGRGPMEDAAPPAAPEDQQGEGAVDRSKSNADRRDAETGADADEAEKKVADSLEGLAKRAGYSARREGRMRKLKEEGASDEIAEAEAANVVKTVGTRSFVWTDGIWLESDLTNAELFGAEVVDYLSDRYFELAREKGNVSKILALGTEVIFRNGDTCIRVVEKTDTAETPEEDSTDGASKEG